MKSKTWRLVLLGLLGLALAAHAQEAPDPQLRELLEQAAERNPDVLAARGEFEAARSRVSPAAALDDPMLELGVVNLPVQSLSFREEDMTMKMIGFAQRVPYPGKRALRRDMAEREADAAESGVRELVNRVQRDVKAAYFDLALVDESVRLVEKNRRIVEQLLSVAESRYSVGQGAQADVLRAQTQLARMQDELIKLGAERPGMEADLNRALGSAQAPRVIEARLPRPQELALDLEALRRTARERRPWLAAQQSMLARNDKALELARKDYYPDFDFRVSYGQRDNFMDMRREDMISFTIAFNLPVWRGAKREPRVAEAQAMREQAARMYDARLNELDAMLRQQKANAEQALKSARLYETAILPQARLAVEASLAAYKVGRVDFPMLLDSQMTVFSYETAYAASVTRQHKALAEIELLTGEKVMP